MIVSKKLLHLLPPRNSMTHLRLVALSTVLVACTTTVVPAPAPAPAETPAAAPAAPVEEPAVEEPAEPFEQFGEVLSTKVKSVEFADILAAPDTFDGQEVITHGTVRANCQKRGCWMEVRPDAVRDGSSATVRFLDYGFFMPLDSRGARVKFQGTIEVAVLTKGQVDEMEAEGGTVVDKRPDGSAKALLIIASGVEMRGRANAKTK